MLLGGDSLNGLDSKKRKDKLSALKRLVKDALETNSTNIPILNLKFITAFWSIAILVISVVEYNLLSNLFTRYSREIHTIKIYTERTAQISRLNSYIIDFLTINQDDTIPNYFPEYNNVTERENIKLTVEEII
mmetsp:Transcript_5269/g.4461  ORF Transcript_5269/g.4461 Transcript_5269/m.4461 type:complete len:133 (+) Transcript_5269:556-954(+)